MITVDSVTVPYQILRQVIFRECFDDLLGCPFGRGMVSDVEMQYAATFMCQHNEYKQHLQLQCRNSKEVDGDQLADVLALLHPGRLAQLPHPRDKRDLIFPRCQRRGIAVELAVGAIAVELALGSTTND